MSAVGTARLFVRIGSAADGTSIQTSGATLVATFANDGIEAVLLGGGDDEIVLRDGTISVAAIDAAAGSDTLAYTDPRGGWGLGRPASRSTSATARRQVWLASTASRT